jgi:hypothetical protein
MTIPHTIPETNLDQIVDKLAEMRAARSKGDDAMDQRSIEHRADGDRKQVARPGRAA